MSEYERQVLEDLCVLKAQMEQLLGIGQPGRLHQLELRVESHERNMQRLKGPRRSVWRAADAGAFVDCLRGAKVVADGKKLVANS